MSSSVTHTETTTTLRAADGDRSCVIVIDRVPNEGDLHVIDVTLTKGNRTDTFRIESDSDEIDLILTEDNGVVGSHAYVVESSMVCESILTMANKLYAFSLAHQ